jgi:hypothetical protein
VRTYTKDEAAAELAFIRRMAEKRGYTDQDIAPLIAQLAYLTEPSEEEVAAANAYLAALTPDEVEYLAGCERDEECRRWELYSEARRFRSDKSSEAGRLKHAARAIGDEAEERNEGTPIANARKAAWAKGRLAWRYSRQRTPEEQAEHTARWDQIWKDVLGQAKRDEQRAARNKRHHEKRATSDPEKAAEVRARKNLRSAEVRLAKAQARIVELEKAKAAGGYASVDAEVSLPAARAFIPEMQATVERWRRELAGPASDST